MKTPCQALRILAAIFTGLVTVATSMSPLIRYEPANREFIFQKGGLIFFIRGSGPIGAMSGERTDAVTDHADLPFVVRNDGAEPVEFSTSTATLMIGNVSLHNELAQVIRLGPGDTKEVYLRFGFPQPPHLARSGKAGRVRLGTLIGAQREELPVEVDVTFSEDSGIRSLYADALR